MHLYIAARLKLVIFITREFNFGNFTHWTGQVLIKKLSRTTFTPTSRDCRPKHWPVFISIDKNWRQACRLHSSLVLLLVWVFMSIFPEDKTYDPNTNRITASKIVFDWAYRWV